MVSKLRRRALLVCLFVATASDASPLFDDDHILEIRLTGPLTSVVRDTRHRKERPFTITVDGVTTDVHIRVRGNSRVRLCRFPPLRINFPESANTPALFAGLDKVKFVTHCNTGSRGSGTNVLNEYLAYRIFGLLADQGLRVRLLRVSYVDTDGKMKKLDEQYYGFLIEPIDRLAERLDGEVQKVDGVPNTGLVSHGAALLNVFQYLIGNSDWSFVTAEGEEHCCHNIELLRSGTDWVLVPYDFDLAGLVGAKYRSGLNVNQTRRRVYGGYCKTPPGKMAAALEAVGELEGEIIALAREVPSTDDKSARRRIEYLEKFFALDHDDLLRVFDRYCQGPR